MPRSGLGLRSVVRDADGEWCIPSPTDPWGPGVPVPGARDMTVRERIGRKVRRANRSGTWIEIDKDTAAIHPDVLTWCRRHCNSETPSGVFLVAPKVWAKHANATIDYPYVPEIDHPSETIRELAFIEWRGRCGEADVRKAKARRHELIQAAGDEAHSRRQIAELLGLSLARVQQLTRTPSTADDSSDTVSADDRAS